MQKDVDDHEDAWQKAAKMDIETGDNNLLLDTEQSTVCWRTMRRLKRTKSLPQRYKNDV